MDLVIGLHTDYTDKIIYSYLNLPFVRNIIVSCWESDKKSNIFDSRVRFVRSPAYDGWFGSANVNLQLTTCLAGVQASDAPWVGKMRSDQLFNEDGLINMYEFFSLSIEKMILFLLLVIYLNYYFTQKTGFTGDVEKI